MAQSNPTSKDVELHLSPAMHQTHVTLGGSYKLTLCVHDSHGQWLSDVSYQP